MAIISFSCSVAVTRISRTEFTGSGDAFSLHMECDVCCGFFINALHWVEINSFYTESSGVLFLFFLWSWKDVRYCQIFFCTICDIYCFFSLICFGGILMIDCLRLNHPCIPGGECHLDFDTFFWIKLANTLKDFFLYIRHWWLHFLLL